MTDDPKDMSCAEFQDQLADLIGSGTDPATHPHIQSCSNCRRLLAELETIAEAARQLLPVVEPPDDLWEHIESAIRSDEGETGSGVARTKIASSN